jgi:O-antigen/teichoic acid export membrane protein
MGARPKREAGLLKSAIVVLAGQGLARLLGFLFNIAAARMLAPNDYGTLAYALAILTAASILLTNSPGGLSRFLSRNMKDRPRQEIYYTNWLAVILLMFGASVVIFLPFAPLSGLTGWLLVGAIANLANIAVFETYLQVQRGLGRFGVIGVYYTLSNGLQLVAILVAGALGFRSAELFLVIYGLSAIAALFVMRVVAPTPLTLRPWRVYWRHIWRISRYVAPVIVQGVFYAGWFGADLILIQHIMSPTATANYAAAKTVTQLLILAPTALSLVVSPRIARLSEDRIRDYLPRVIALTALATIPVDLALAVVQGPLSMILYGSKYPHMLDAFTPLVVGMAWYGFYLVMASVWGALGRPVIGAVATGLGTPVTIGLALFLVPRIGLAGGGVAFAAGAGAQLVVILAYTLYGLYAGNVVRVGHLPDEAMLSLGNSR